MLACWVRHFHRGSPSFLSSPLLKTIILMMPYHYDDHDRDGDCLDNIESKDVCGPTYAHFIHSTFILEARLFALSKNIHKFFPNTHRHTQQD